MKKILRLMVFILIVFGLVACNSKEIILATTTSTENSGLLAAILPEFEKETGISVKVVAVGTGAALQMGRDGEADVLLVHAKADEIIFVDEGHGVYRKDVMYNDFIIVGPRIDPLGIKNLSLSEAFMAFKKSTFVSRGDQSGTHKKELSIWKNIEIDPFGDWYISSGQGMGDTLGMADEMLAYTLTDRATYLSMQENIDLVILLEGDETLFNQYGVIPLNPVKNSEINSEDAEAFVTWLMRDSTQEMIAQFGIDQYGQALFYPNAE